MVESFDAFFSDFSITAILPDGAEVAAIFDRAYADPLGIANGAPRLVAASASVAALEPDDEIAIGADYWAVREIQPDGAGITVLILELA